MLHHLNADVAGVFVCEQGVGVIHHSGDDAAQHGEPKLGPYEPPQALRYRGLVPQMVIDDVDNQLSDKGDRDREQCGNHSRNDSEGDDARPRLPDDLQYRRNIAKRRETLLPATPKRFFF